ncbi:MAG: hypothetical protein AAF548_13605 [Actinomycetota bacterium]
MAAAEHAVVEDARPGARLDQRREVHAELKLVADRVAPLALARERTLPVHAALQGLFPEGGLRRGSVVAVDGVGATSLALAVAAGPSASGSWVAVVGEPDLGLAAAHETGVALERMLVIDPSGGRVGTVLAALVGAVDVVIVGSAARVRPAEMRRLSARMRERGSVIIRIGAGDQDGIDVGLRVVDHEWTGLGVGHGVLRARRVRVQAAGRGASAKPRAAALLLPGPAGEPVELGERADGGDEAPAEGSDDDRGTDPRRLVS